MDLARFSVEEWEAVFVRLDAGEGGFNRETFMAWLVKRGTDAALNKKYGRRWKLGEALDTAKEDPLAFAPAPEPKKGGRPKKQVEEPESEDGEPVIPRPDPETLEAQRQARMDLYLAEFEGVTPNDKASLEAMVSAELNLEWLRKLQQEETIYAVKPNSATVERLAKTIKIYEELHSTLQKSLGIDRVAREKKARTQSAEDQVWDLMRQGAEWVENEVLKIRHKCGEETGLLLMVFREHPYRVQSFCPGCQELFWVEHVPSEADKQAMNEPAWVAEEEAQYKQHMQTSGDNRQEDSF